MSSVSILGAALPPPPTLPQRLAIVEDELVIRQLLHQYLCRGP